MEKLGVWLRQTREARGDTLRDAEKATRVRVRFLEMLEAGEFAGLPGGEVQVRGFLRIYARYLDLSPEKVLARYDAEARGAGPAPVGAPAPLDAPANTQPAPSAPFQTQGFSAPVPRPRWMNPGALVAAAAGLIVVLVIVAAAVYFGRGQGEQAAAITATATPLADALLPTETPAAPELTPTFPANPEGGVTLTLEATEHVWACVLTDGRTVFEGLLSPGQIETWSGQEAVIVDTGNGAGLLVTINDQPQGTMCGRGEVCSRVWGPRGEIHTP
jgi:cytoskeleton protein RodZ